MGDLMFLLSSVFFNVKEMKVMQERLAPFKYEQSSVFFTQNLVSNVSINFA